MRPGTVVRCVGLGVVAASISSCGDVKAAAILSQVHGVALTPAQPKPDFTLDDTEGRPFHFSADTRGTVALVYFGYTNCPDVCPAQLANIAAGLKAMSASDRAKVRVLFVTTDPARDTPDRLRAWLNNFDRRFIGLRGSVDSVTAIEARFGLPPATVEMLDAGAPGPRAAYGMSHAAQVFAFTPDDSLRVEYPSGFTVGDWQNDLPKLARIR